MFPVLPAPPEVDLTAGFYETKKYIAITSYQGYDVYYTFDDEAVLSEGEDFHTADLDFGRGSVKIGSMICFDREFPESARILMLKGAELILAPNACPMEINRLAALRTRVAGDGSH